MVEALNIPAVVASLQRASSANEIFMQAQVLAEGLSHSPIIQLVLEASIAMSVARIRHSVEALPREELVKVIARANREREDAGAYLGVGADLVPDLKEEGDFLVDKILNGTGAPFDEETLAVARRMVRQHEYGVPPRVMRAASVQVLRRERK